MKKFFSLLFIALLSCVVVQAQTSMWAERIGGTGYDEAKSIAVDASGNVYAAGVFSSSTLTFNNGITLTNSGYVHAYIAKYNSSGVCQWAQKIAGTNNDYANRIVVDASGNVFVAGYFMSPTLSFNNGITLTNSGGNDGFITKYNSSGVCQWAQKIAGTNDDRAQSIVVDASGNVLAAGYFSSPTLSFNNGITLTNSSPAYVEAYITKYNSSGVCQWAEKIAGLGFDYAYSIAVDPSGNVFAAGYFASPTLTFNNGFTLTGSSVDYNAYITKYNSSGVCQWAEKIAGLGDDKANSIAVDALGNVFATGSFQSPTLTFNNGFTLTNTLGFEDAYIAKYNSSGVCQWAQKFGGTSPDFAQSIAVDASGNVYTAGNFQSPTLTFNNGITLTNSGSDDAFMTKYNSAGVCQWAQKFGGTSNDYAYGITVDASGNVFATGSFQSPTLTFNNGISLTISGNYDGFIAKYMQPPPPTLTTTPIINITESGATSGGNITTIGGAVPTVRGLCWNTAGIPTTNDSKTEETGTFGTGAFAASITGLEPNTVYKVRAYATNCGSTGYGNELAFTTIPTLGEWGLILFGSLIAAIGGVVVWRRIS